MHFRQNFNSCISFSHKNILKTAFTLCSIVFREYIAKIPTTHQKQEVEKAH